VQKSIIYCDESGNDGPNYLSKVEPFYVLSGWVVPHDKIVDASAIIEKMRKKHCPQSDDLKFRMFKGKPYAITETVTALGQAGLVPVYLAAEKRYCIAAKIVETFLDPDSNPLLRTPFTGDIHTKQELANTLYNQLNDDVLAQFAEAYRRPSEEKLRAALEEVATHFAAAINPELATLLRGSLPNLKTIAEVEIGVVESWGKAMGTLNYPCLIAFLMLVEHLARQAHLQVLKLVHDEQGPYQDDYRKAFLMYKGAKQGQILLDGMRVPHSDLQMIDDFEIQTSVDQPLIQAADILSGSVHHLFASLLNGRELHKQEVELGGLLLPAILTPDELPLTYLVCSDRMLGLIGPAIAKAYPIAEKNLEVDDSPVRWVSTMPDGKLPILPSPAPSAGLVERRPDFTFKIDLPLFAFAHSNGHLAILLPSEREIGEATDWECYVPLWLSRQMAEAYLRDAPESGAFHIVEFGPKELRSLVERLREASTHTEFVRVFSPENYPPPYPILRLADDFERILDRLVRSVNSGMMETIKQIHTVDGEEVISILLSSGGYAAGRLSSPNPSALGKTREEAVANLARMLREEK